MTLVKFEGHKSEKRKGKKDDAEVLIKLSFIFLALLHMLRLNQKHNLK